MEEYFILEKVKLRMPRQKKLQEVLMKKKLLVTTIITTFILGLLTGCGVDNNRFTDDDRGNKLTPVRYDRRYDNDDMFRENETIRRRNLDPIRYENEINRGLLDDTGILNDNETTRNLERYRMDKDQSNYMGKGYQ